MKLSRAFACLCFSQAVLSSVLSNNVGRDDVEQVQSPTRSLPQRRDAEAQRLRRERFLERRERRRKRDEVTTNAGPKIWSVVPENIADVDGNKNAQTLIEQKLQDAGIDKKFMIVLPDPYNRTQTLGWGGLQFKDGAIEELKNHPAIKDVIEDEKPKKFRSVPQGFQDGKKDKKDKVGKRALNWDNLKWYKDPNAQESLLVISQYPGANIDQLNDYVYEQHRARPSNGQGIFIYVIDEGIEVNVKLSGTDIQEFPNREATVFTHHCVVNGRGTETDDDRVEWHGTAVASVALGQWHGVAKGATLVPIKYYGELTAVAEAIDLAQQHIAFFQRQQNSVVVVTAGSAHPSDPLTVVQNVPSAGGYYRSLNRLLDMGVPVVSTAGNDRAEGRDQVDFFPGYWEGEDFPIINVGETEHNGHRSEDSQGGPHVTTWAPTYPADVMYGNGESTEESGTSFGAGMVAGVIANAMAFDEPPWGGLVGRRRAQAIRAFIKDEERSGWRRQGGERVVWNGATRAAHESAEDDPNTPDWPDEEPEPEPTDAPMPTQAPPPPPPPKREPKSLQIGYETFVTEGAEKWQAWNFFEGEQGKAVDQCSKPLLHHEGAPEVKGWNIPFIEGEWNLRFAGYAEDCKFQGIGRKGEAGDVGWLHCPERKAIKCIEDANAHSGKNGWKMCQMGGKSKAYAYCDWE